MPAVMPEPPRAVTVIKRLIIVSVIASYYVAIRTVLYLKLFEPTDTTEFIWWWSWLAAIPISFVIAAIPLRILAFIIGPEK